MSEFLADETNNNTKHNRPVMSNRLIDDDNNNNNNRLDVVTAAAPQNRFQDSQTFVTLTNEMNHSLLEHQSSADPIIDSIATDYKIDNNNFLDNLDDESSYESSTMNSNSYYYESYDNLDYYDGQNARYIVEHPNQIEHDSYLTDHDLDPNETAYYYEEANLQQQPTQQVLLNPSLADSRNYFLTEQQMLLEQQRQLMAINANPYSLHTIYEESEYESSSSLPSVSSDRSSSTAVSCNNNQKSIHQSESTLVDDSEDLENLVNRERFLEDQELFSSKLERYFTSGLLEQPKQQPNKFHQTSIDQYEKLGSIIKKSMKFKADNLMEHLNINSYIFKFDLKRFLVRILTKIEDNEKDDQIINGLLMDYDKPADLADDIKRLLIDGLIAKTLIQHLLWNHRLWSFIFEALLIKNYFRPRLGYQSAKSRITNRKKARTVIIVTENGTKLLINDTKQETEIKKPMVARFIDKQPNSHTSIKILNQIKQPQYRTILKINDNIANNDHSADIDDQNSSIESNEMNNKRTNFLRSANPLNRSFLAKISEQNWSNNHEIEDPAIVDSQTDGDENYGKVKTPSRKLPSSRNSFRQVYDLLLNPFKSVKKNKLTKKEKSTPVEPIDDLEQTKAMKSFSEPNLNGKRPRNGRIEDGVQQQPELVDYEPDYDDEDDEIHLHSKSTSQLLNEPRFSTLNQWTASWDRRLPRYSTDRTSNGVKRTTSQSVTKNGLQRSLSGSNRIYVGSASTTSLLSFGTKQNLMIPPAINKSLDDVLNSSQYSNNDCRTNGNGLPSTNHHQLKSIGRICLSIYYEQQLNSLTITIFRANLDMIKRFKNELYVKVYIITNNLANSERLLKKKTKPRKGSKIETGNGPIFEIEYNDILRFGGKWRQFVNAQLTVSLWSKDKFAKNSLLGQSLIQLTEQEILCNSIQTRCWHDLLLPNNLINKNSNSIDGTLFLVMKYEDEKQFDKMILNNERKQPEGILHVWIKEAEFNDLTPLVQYNLESNIYCKLSLKPERSKDDKQKTPIVQMTANPKWNYEIIFKNITKNDLIIRKQLEILVVLQDKSNKHYLGNICLNNSDEAYPEERNLWRQLSERPNLCAYGRIPLRHD